jgi:hypothetical protein
VHRSQGLAAPAVISALGTRCWKAQDICAIEAPALVDRGQGHPVACDFAGEHDQV